MLNIQDKVFVSLKIDGDEVQYAGLISVIGTEGNGALIPALKIAVQDPLSLLSSPKQTITEGNEIEILVSKSFTDNIVRPRKYRVFAVHRSNQAFNPVLEIICILNAPKFFSKSSIEAYTGSSETVLSSVASKSDLTFSGPSSVDGRTMNDSQKWLGVCRSRATFVQDVVKHGWIDDHSGMSASVTSHGELRYRDLIDLINTPIDKVKFLFAHNAPIGSVDDNRKIYIVKESKDRSSAGVMTTWQNYGSTRVQNKLTGDVDSHKSVQVKMPGSYLPINSEVAGQVERSRIEYAPLDCGNVHAKYEIAQYQNIKLTALFTEKMSLLVDVVTEVQLYDVVLYRQEDADLTQPIKNTDVYIVVGKTYAISGGSHYAERIELSRMSLTMDGNSALAKPGDFSSERSLIPDVTVNNSAMGVAASSNRGSALSLASKVGNISTGNSMLDGLKNTLASPLSGVASRLDTIHGQIANGTMSPTGITSMLTDVRSLVAASVGIQSIYNYASNANYGLLNDLKGAASSTQYSLISQSNSITTSLVNQYAIALPMQAVFGAMQSTLGIIPSDIVKSSSDYAALHRELAGALYDVSMLTGNTNGQWNNTLSIIRGFSIPSSYGNNTPQIAINIQQGLRTPTMTDTSILSILHTGLTRDYGGQPNWMSPTSINPMLNMPNARSAIDNATQYTTRLYNNLSA